MKDTHPAFLPPDLSSSWADTLDTLRPPRGRDEPFWGWRKKPPHPVVFSPPGRINSGVCHLHLQHPLVQRVLLFHGTSKWNRSAQGPCTLPRRIDPAQPVTKPVTRSVTNCANRGQAVEVSVRNY